MKKIYFLVIVMVVSLVSNAQTPVYSNNFENGLGTAKIVGSGKIETAAKAGFGSVFHNAASGQAIRSNYLLLPNDIFSNVQSSGKKELTIAFWVNKGTATDYFWTPIFSAYAAAPIAGKNTWPMLALESRLWVQLNCAGWNDFVKTDNPLGANLESTAWLDDGAWHYYTVTMTASMVKVYVDGTVQNSWNVSGADGHTVAGLFTNGTDLQYICLGGNQAWDWGDVDPAYMYDDVAIYSSALTIDQIKANITAKIPTAVSQLSLDSNGELLGKEYFNINGIKVGKNFKLLSPGIYIQKSTYSSGAIKSEKIAKTLN